MSQVRKSIFILPFIILLFCVTLQTNLLAAVIDESGSLLEFFAGSEENCAYDNWVSHTSEYDYFGNGDGYFAPHELDRETNGFGSYQDVDDMVDPDGVLADWSTIFRALINNQVATAENCLAQSEFAGSYQLVRLNDNGTEYLILREVLNNNYVDDNGTVGAGDDVTGSFDLGWGLYVFNPSASNPELVIEMIHPSSDFHAPYVAIDAFLTTDAGLFFINGASRNIAWSGDVYNTSNSLSDPSRNARTPFQEAHKAAVDLIDDEWVIQVHGYNAYPQHDGRASVQLSAERENYTAHPNAPYMNWDHIDLISLTPNPAVPNGGGWQYPEVLIDDYYTASYPGGYRYKGYIPIPNNVDLPGTVDNNQMVYSHIGHDFVNDRENWLHMELDEFPDVVRLAGTTILDFYGYDAQNLAVPTYNNFASVVHYYRPIFQAIIAYENYTPQQSENISETASLQEFYQGVEGYTEYDNWVSHISEGVADAGYNDEGPAGLDRQLDGFGNFQLIPADVGGDSLLSTFYDIFVELFQGNVNIVQSMLTDARLGGKYEVVTITDNGNDYYVLREVLNDYYFDDNGTPGDGSDDITGSFDYGWGLFVVNPNAVNPEIVIEVPHPCDDYTTPAIGFDAFMTTGAGLMFVNGAGREVEWTESAPYYNSKSLSDPTRNERTPFHEAHKAAVDMFGSEFIIQIHSYDTDSHPNSYDSELSTRDDPNPNKPVADASTYFDIISLTPEYPVAANTIGGSNHSARRVDDYYSLYNGGVGTIAYYHEGNIAISNYVEQPGYVENPQMLYTQANHDQQADDEPWLHVEHDEFPNVITESVTSFYNIGSGVPTHENYANVVDYFHPMYAAIGAYFDGPNQAPVLAVIGDQTVDENATLTFTLSGSDPDGDALTYSVSNLPTGATFIDVDFSWTPDYSQAGSYDVTFEVSDGDLTDNEMITITVTNINQAPILTSIGDQATDEGATLAFTLFGSDPDVDALTYSSPNLPNGATLIDADFSWTPDFDQAGAHSVTFEVSDGDLTDDETITITVTNINRAPVLAAIGNKSVEENATLAFTLSGSDPDNDGLTYSASNLPEGATLIGTGFSWTPTEVQLGAYDVTFEVSDGYLITDETITITVTNVNQAPVLAAIGDQTVDEGSTLAFTLPGSDPDGDALTYSSPNLPNGATLIDADFSWTPDFAQAGAHSVTFEVSDGNLTANETITIAVANINQAPVLTAIGDKGINENATLAFTLSGSDPDGDALTYSSPDLPTGAVLDGVDFSWTPDYDQAGPYDVTFEVTDGVLTANETITITVNDVNRAPVLSSIGDQTVNEGATLTFALSGSDPDGDALIYSSPDLPTGATLDGVSFSWTPDYDQSGTYNVTFEVSDGDLTANEIITITVYGINQAPVLATIGDQTVDEYANLSFSLSGSDPDGDALTYSATNLPAGATLVGADFSWTTDYDNAGAYGVTFEVTDGDLTADETITITVNNINRAPVWTSVPANVSDDEGALITFTVTGSDPDGDALTIDFDPDLLPVDASFTDVGDGTGDFSWQTIEGDAGDYSPTFTLSDGSLTDAVVTTISVIGPALPQTAFTVSEQTISGSVQGDYTNTDQSNNSYEVITEIESGGKPSNRHSLLEHIWTFDITGNTLVLEAEAHHSSNGEGDDFILSGSFDGQNYTDLITVTKTNDDDQAQTAAIDGAANGAYYVKVVDTDRSQSNRNLDSFSLDYLAISYYQGDPPNQAPVWTDVPESVSADTGALVEFTVTGTDPEGDGLSISVDPDVIPDGWEFTDNGDGTGFFSWQTSENDAGDYTPTFTISDGELTADVVIPISITVPGQNVMLVSDIEQTPNVLKKTTNSIAVITITDDGGSALADATVSVTWSGLSSGDAQGTTDGNGQVTFSSGNVNNRNADGYFTITVTDVAKADWTYDSDQNVITTHSLGVGDAAAGNFGSNNMQALPNSITFDAAYPNPFNSQTTLRYGLPDAGNVRISIYDLRGRKVSTLMDEFQLAGWYSAIWSPSDLANGGYIIRLESGNSIKTMSVVYVK